MQHFAFAAAIKNALARRAAAEGNGGVDDEVAAIGGRREGQVIPRLGAIQVVLQVGIGRNGDVGGVSGEVQGQEEKERGFHGAVVWVCGSNGKFVFMPLAGFRPADVSTPILSCYVGCSVSASEVSCASG